MDAKVVETRHNQTFPKRTGGTFTCSVLVVDTIPKPFRGQTKPVERKEYKFFASDPYAEFLNTVQPGQKITLDMVKEGSIWKIANAKPLTSSATGGSNSQSRTEQSRKNGGSANNNTPAAALVAPEETLAAKSVEVAAILVKLAAENGAYKKGTKLDILTEEVLRISSRLKAHMLGGEEIIVSTTTNEWVLPKNTPDEEEMPDDGDVPF